MPHQLTLDLPDEVFQPLAQAAEHAGQSLEQWATAQLRSCAASSSKQAIDLARLMAHAGAVDLGNPTGAGNESIDADLAGEYGSSHEERS
ncbi:MAG TPA: hypothetical protein PK867_29870 [Pirellulales bacterium]|nr:hypothetical protein [Pirellulales bacterium]